MAHKSENCRPLDVISEKIETLSNGSFDLSKPNVWLFHLPTNAHLDQKISEEYLKKTLMHFFDVLSQESIIAFLTHPHIACQLTEKLQNQVHFKLWVAIKREQPISKPGTLPDDHVALLIFSNNKKTLKHNRTQIAYTYCPACQKTTKDYGGKKHLYSPYGTLMSDVWRDICYTNCKTPDDIINRLRDLFGTEFYSQLIYCDLQDSFELISKKPIYISNKKINDPGKNRLINGDSLDVLRTIPDNSIDFIFADPPYNIKKKYESWDDAQDISNYFSWCDKWIFESARILKPGRTFAIINIPLWVVRHFSFAQNILNFQDWIAWEGLSLPVRKIMPAHYGIICFSKGKPNAISNHVQIIDKKMFPESMSLKQWYCVRNACTNHRNAIEITDREPISNLWWDIHRLKHNSKRVDHPCQLPPALMKRIIHTFTRENEVILDPFNGAGTTTLVAQMLGRKFIGIELSEKYHAIAQQRHQNLQQGMDPFAKNGTTPASKNSRVARLKKQKYEVPKKKLQLEVKEIAFKLGRKPSRDDVVKFSKYPIRYFDEYFIDWGEVCSAVGDKGMVDDPSLHISSSPKVQQIELSFGS